MVKLHEKDMRRIKKTNEEIELEKLSKYKQIIDEQESNISHQLELLNEKQKKIEDDIESLNQIRQQNLEYS